MTNVKERTPSVWTGNFILFFVNNILLILLYLLDSTRTAPIGYELLPWNSSFFVLYLFSEAVRLPRISQTISGPSTSPHLSGNLGTTDFFPHTPERKFPSICHLKYHPYHFDTNLSGRPKSYLF